MNIPTQRLCDMENQLIALVSSGQYQNIERFIITSFADKNPNSVKAYLIGINAILKKTAEYKGVSLIDASKTSAKYLSKIEILDLQASSILLKEMCISYCNLVGEIQNFKYSTPVARAIMKINQNLTADLSLKALAKYNNISAGYFSALFKKETELTLTDYVNKKRIDYAKQLLNCNIKIKDISEMCGFKDANYFVRLFKKYENNTPTEYRDTKVNK